MQDTVSREPDPNQLRRQVSTQHCHARDYLVSRLGRSAARVAVPGSGYGAGVIECLTHHSARDSAPCLTQCPPERISRSGAPQNRPSATNANPLRPASPRPTDRKTHPKPPPRAKPPSSANHRNRVGGSRLRRPGQKLNPATMTPLQSHRSGRAGSNDPVLHCVHCGAGPVRHAQFAVDVLNVVAYGLWTDS